MNNEERGSAARSGVAPMRLEPWPLEKDQPRCYFVHSYRVPMPEGTMGDLHALDERCCGEMRMSQNHVA